MKIKIEFSNRFIQYLLWIPFLKPSYFSEYKYLDIFFDSWKVMAALLILCFYLKKHDYSKMMIAICFFQLLTVGLTFIHGQNISLKLIFLEIVPTICVCCLVEINIRYCFIKSLHVIQNIGLVLLFSNICTIIQYPVGMPRSGIDYAWTYMWLLGSKNYQIVTIFPIVIITLLLKVYLKRWRLIDIGILLLAELTCLLNTSTTSFIAMSLLILLVLIIPTKMSGIINIATYMFIAATSHILIVIFGAQRYFTWLLEGILGKSVTFTSRTLLWNRIIQCIWEKPILGYGMLDNGERVHITGIWFAVHAHNQFLEILFQGGIILFIAFNIILLMLVEKLYNYRYSETAKILSIAIFTIMTLFLTEYFSQTIFVFWMFLLAYYVDDIHRKFLEEQDGGGSNRMSVS